MGGVQRSSPRTRILLAAAQDVGERLHRVLAGHEIVVARSLDKAIELVEQQQFGMVVIDVHFDDSQMFELLHHVRTNRQDHRVPVVCILGVRHTIPMSKVMIEGLNYAVKALTANAFLDLAQMPDDEAGNARLRRIIDYLILIDGDLHQGLPEE